MGKREQFLGYLFIAPSFIGITIFMIIPALFSLFLSFTEWNHLAGFSNIEFVGLAQFAKLWDDSTFMVSLKNNIIYTFLGVPIAVVISLLVAVILNDKVFGKNIFRAAFFLPYITNGIAVAFVWMLLFHPRQGPINSFLTAVGVESPPLWLASSTWALPALVIIYIWAHIGFNTIIYIANLQNISKELYEAAEVDGAKSWHKFVFITVPLLSPTTFFLMIIGVIGSLKVFGIIVALTQGGPGNSTTVLAYYVYVTAFNYYDMGYASAISWILFIIIFIFTFIQWQLQKKWVHY